ncbi:MAG: DegV family protein [Anaerolineales bacterium]|jgi:DegV family protein with EDD domain
MAASRIGIVTDSTSDIPDDEARELDIQVVPAVLVIGEETLQDGREISRSDFYRRMPEFPQPATTGSPSPAVFGEKYQSFFDQGVERILSIHVAASLSGMLNSAAQAAKDFGDRVQLYDSGQVSMGLGLLAIEAAIAARAGASLEEVTHRIRAARERVHLVALIRTLEYLRRSGRVSWLQAGVGDLLRIKMLLTVRDGLVEAVGRARTWSRGLSELTDLAHSWSPFQRLAVLHSGIPDEAAELAKQMRPLCENEPAIVQVTTVIGAHVGPGSLGLAGLQRG